MMKKKLFAVLTAVVCLTSGSMLVSANYFGTSEDILAEYQKEYLESLSGGVLVHTSNANRCFYVVTDGTILSEEHVQDLTDYSSLSIIEWEEGEQYIYPDISAELGENVYEVRFTSTENLRDTARRFQLENDFVENVYLLRSHSYCEIEVEPILRLTPIDNSVELRPEDFPELENLATDDITIDGITLEGSGYWYAFLTGEIMEECHKTNPEGSYGSYLFMKEIADRILAEHGDVLIAAEPAMQNEIPVTRGYFEETQSIWQTAGDPNADGTVDAQDAASLLEAAAQIGSGARIAVTDAADVNADGTVGADDAAAVLTYAAAAGSGNPVSWVEILRK